MRPSLICHPLLNAALPHEKLQTSFFSQLRQFLALCLQNHDMNLNQGRNKLVDRFKGRISTSQHVDPKK